MPHCNLQIIRGSGIKQLYYFPSVQTLLLTLAVLLCMGITVKAQSRIFLSAIDSPTGIYGSYSNVLVDLNGDGKLDIVTPRNLILGNGDGTFKPGASHATEYGPYSFTLGDFDGDGKLDLVGSGLQDLGGNSSQGKIIVLLGNGDGTFRHHITFNNNYGAPPVASGDFNGDGKLDLVTPSHLFLGNGDGTFQPRIEFGTGRDLLVGDFNHDGKLDVATTYFDGYKLLSFVYVYLGKGDGTFQSPIKSPTGVRYLVSISTSDFNGDGNPDLAVSSYNDGYGTESLSVWIGNGTGTFQSTVSYDLDYGDSVITESDLNGDGIIDFAVANSRAKARVLLGNGDGTFKDGLTYAISPGALAVLVGDFNKDGKADLAALGSYSGIEHGMSVLLGNGDGTLQGAVVYNPDYGLTATVTGDFNGDGKLDQATANNSGNGISVLLGNGDGTLQSPVNYAVGLYSYDIAVSDFNGDGKLDLASANLSTPSTGFRHDSETDSFQGSLSVLLGNGDGTFRKPINYLSGKDVTLVIAADINNDGKPDLVAAYSLDINHSDTDYIDVLTGRGDGTFSDATRFYVDNRMTSIAAGDFNGDRKLDLAITSFNESRVNILIGIGDGTFQAPSLYPFEAYAEKVITEDFNGDGNLDLAVGGYATEPSQIAGPSLLFGNGDGTFKSAINYQVFGDYDSVTMVAEDFNGDGNLDLAAISNNVGLLLGNADGTFQKPAFYNGITWRATAGDFNGDGKPELIGLFSMMLNVAPNSSPTLLAGKILDSSGAPLGGVTVTLKSASKTQQTITDSAGHYLFTNLLEGDFYTLAPASNKYSFSPANRSFSFTNNKQDVAFTAGLKANPLDTVEFFIHQHYLDFLNREPDQEGLSYWTNQITQCGADAACINRKRVDVSAAFFIEQEFQQTGFFIYRLYKAAYGARPTFAQFTSDRMRIAGGQNLEASKAALADEFVTRAEFKTAYPDSLSNADFVNKLFDTANLRPYVAERQARIVALTLRTETRAQVLRDVAEFAEFKQREYNRAFVLAEYFGYLKRDPDNEGYQFWLGVLNSQRTNNYRGMVCAFLTSAEYQQRFGSIITHTNAECGP